AIRGPIATALPARPSRRIAAGKTALRRLVMILQRDQESLERAQRYECRQEYQRAPQQRVNPVRRRIKDFHHQCRPGDNKAGKKHHEKSRSVGGVGKGEIEAALLATRTQRKKPSEQTALAAARTASHESSREGQRWRISSMAQVRNPADTPPLPLAAGLMGRCPRCGE